MDMTENEGYMIFIPEFLDDLPVETYRLALESVYRWAMRTDEIDPMEIIRAIRTVTKTALQSNN